MYHTTVTVHLKSSPSLYSKLRGSLLDLLHCSFRSVRPSLIEYLSYNLNFLSVLVGPCSDYKDYIDFIEGRHISQRLRQHAGTCTGQNGFDKTADPSPLVSSWICLLLAALILYNDTARLWTAGGHCSDMTNYLCSPPSVKSCWSAVAVCCSSSPSLAPCQ